MWVGPKRTFVGGHTPKPGRILCCARRAAPARAQGVMVSTAMDNKGMLELLRELEVPESEVERAKTSRTSRLDLLVLALNYDNHVDNCEPLGELEAIPDPGADTPRVGFSDEEQATATGQERAEASMLRTMLAATSHRGSHRGRPQDPVVAALRAADDGDEASPVPELSYPEASPDDAAHAADATTTTPIALMRAEPVSEPVAAAASVGATTPAPKHAAVHDDAAATAAASSPPSASPVTPTASHVSTTPTAATPAAPGGSGAFGRAAEQRSGAAKPGATASASAAASAPPPAAPPTEKPIAPRSSQRPPIRGSSSSTPPPASGTAGGGAAAGDSASPLASSSELPIPLVQHTDSPKAAGATTPGHRVPFSTGAPMPTPQRSGSAAVQPSSAGRASRLSAARLQRATDRASRAVTPGRAPPTIKETSAS